MKNKINYVLLMIMVVFSFTNVVYAEDPVTYDNLHLDFVPESTEGVAEGQTTADTVTSNKIV